MIFYYLLASIGIHWILKYGTILNIPRKTVIRVPIFAELFNCSLCLGFWSGIIISLITDVDIRLFPFASAGVCWMVDNINNVLQSIEIKLDNDDK